VRTSSTLLRLFALGLVALRPGAPVLAQDGVLTGVVTDALAGAPLPSASLEARDSATGRVSTRAVSNAGGRFRLTPLPPTPHLLLVTAIGHAPRRTWVAALDSGEVRVISVALDRLTLLEELVVTPGRSAEPVAAAATALSIIGQPALERRLAPAGPTEHLRDVAGMEVSRKGLIQSTFAARGPGAVNSGALMVLTDYRVASVPSLRLNVPYLIPVATEDLDRVEVTRGPGSAVYGPDADRGVVHLISRSPLDRQETVLTVTGGDRSLAEGSIRHASRLGHRLAFKVSADYLHATDWPGESTGELVPRDPHVERAAADLRLDWNAGRDAVLILSAGMADAIRLVDLTEVGAIQLRDWRYKYAQGRLQRGRFFANVFVNANDAGASVQLGNGAPIVDDSWSLTAQMQQGFTLGRAELRVGTDFQHIVPKTGGTIHGRNESDDGIEQVGGFAYAVAPLARALEATAAVRLDHNTRLDDAAFSPRVGLIARPGSGQAIRLTYNRGTSTPVPADLFIDLPFGQLDPSLPYGLRAVGTARPYTFRRDCGGLDGLCMHVPGPPGSGLDPSRFLPADATVAWPIVAALLGPALAGVAPPASGDVTTTLGLLDVNTKTFQPVAPGAVTDIPAGRRTTTSSIELGWRGAIGRRLTASVDCYRTHVSNIGTALEVQTPNVFFDSATLTAYLESQGKSPAEAAALAGAIAAIPVGIVSPAEAANPIDVLLVPRQGRPESWWGADVELELLLARRLRLAGAYSWVSTNVFRAAAGPADAALNAPRNRGSVAVTFEDPGSGIGLDARLRVVGPFPARSGIYQGDVDAYQELDAGLSWNVHWLRYTTLQIAAQNLTNMRHREFIGAPEIGRLVLGRVRVRF
jgi:outer membrane receptor for ferrienterochelin and colicins